MATGKIVTYALESRSYTLPAEHAAVLTKAAGPGNMATFARMIPILSKVEPSIVDSFRHGGGVFYDQFQDFMALWAGVNEQTFERTLVTKVIPLMPEVLAALDAGIDALDMGCGEGHSTNLLAQAYPRSRFTGYDLRERAPGGSGVARIAQRSVCEAGRHTGRTGGLRTRHGFRCDSRSSAAEDGFAERRDLIEAGRHIPHGGHQGFQ
jgi:hypothetical protein